MEVTNETTVTETAETVTITATDIHTMTSDIVHADLFGSFLICGTLIGIALFRRLSK